VAEERSRIYLKILDILSIDSIFPGMGTGEEIIAIYSVVHLITTLYTEWQGYDAHFFILNTHQAPMCIEKYRLGGPEGSIYTLQLNITGLHPILIMIYSYDSYITHKIYE
jgi:hypothetical protein